MEYYAYNGNNTAAQNINMGQEQDQTNGVNGTTPHIQPFVPDKANPALYTNEKREIFMGDSPELNPGPNDCVVRMRCNGICG